MGDIVEFKPPEAPAYCFQCHCGSQHFLMMYGGSVECVECGRVMKEHIWSYIPSEVIERLRSPDG